MVRGVPALDTFINARDTGCEIAPSCLSCPLPACRYDKPVRHHNAVVRKAAIIADYRDGVRDTRELASRHGVTERTIWRAIAGAKRA